jgi:hypothetical protein
VGLGGEAGFVGQASDRFRLQVGGRYIRYLLGETGGVVRGFLGESLSLGRSFELRFVSEMAGSHVQGTVELLGYL